MQNNKGKPLKIDVYYTDYMTDTIYTSMYNYL